jgi:vacuolar-type H+-ATPase subunit I/STV1
MRLHRSLRKKVEKIDPDKVANRAEDYLDGASLYRSELKSLRGLISNERIKKSISKIDALEREMRKLEDKIDALMDKRGVEALKLEDYLLQNFEVVGEFLEPGELRDFK